MPSGGEPLIPLVGGLQRIKFRLGFPRVNSVLTVPHVVNPNVHPRTVGSDIGGIGQDQVNRILVDALKILQTFTLFNLYRAHIQLL